jgi:predicted transcriptional regulator
MECLWSAGTATAEAIRAALADSAHDSSIRTLLRVLEEKGYVAHDVQGKAFVYKALIPRQSAQSLATGSLLQRLFHGSAADLVLRLLEDEVIAPEELQRLAEQARQSATNRKSTHKRQGKQT